MHTWRCCHIRKKDSPIAEGSYSKKDDPQRVLKFYNGNTLYTSIIIIFSSLPFVSLFVCVIFFVLLLFSFDVRFRGTQ